MALIDPSLYAPVFAPFRGKRIGFLSMSGNVGDRMIEEAAYKLFGHYGVEYRVLPWESVRAGRLEESVDEIAVSGGGNMGRSYTECIELRQQALRLGVPVTVLPQSFRSADEDIAPYKMVFVRERASLELEPFARLAPELALALDPPVGMPAAAFDQGVFLRTDGERSVEKTTGSLFDPVKVCGTSREYFRLAACFHSIATDRLHFAIAGLILGRRVTLLPNAYFKNRSMFDTWLADLGCEWRECPPAPAGDRDELLFRLSCWLSGVDAEGEFWAMRLFPAAGFVLEPSGAMWTIRHPDTGVAVTVNGPAAMVWELCDGSRTAADLARFLVAGLAEFQPMLGKDLQQIIGKLLAAGALRVAANE